MSGGWNTIESDAVSPHHLSTIYSHGLLDARQGEPVD